MATAEASPQDTVIWQQDLPKLFTPYVPQRPVAPEHAPAVPVVPKPMQYPAGFTPIPKPGEVPTPQQQTATGEIIPIRLDPSLEREFVAPKIPTLPDGGPPEGPPTPKAPWKSELPRLRPERPENADKGSLEFWGDESKANIAERLLGYIPGHYKKVYWRVIAKALLNHMPVGEAVELLLLWFGNESLLPLNDLKAILADESFKDRRYSYKTLGYLAREGNPEAYRSWHRLWMQHTVENASTTKDSDVAEFLYRLYWLDYINTNGKMSGWLVFKGSRFEPDPEGVGLINRLTFPSIQEAVGRLDMFLQNAQHCLEEASETKVRTEEELRIKRFRNAIDKMKSYGHSQRFLKQAMGKFSQHDYKELTANDNLTGLLNGVIEFSPLDNTAEFRLALPEDYLTKQCPVAYDEKMEWTHPRVEQCMYWLKQVFCDKELLEHWLLLTSAVILGGNPFKMFQIWSGVRDNSKSMIQKLFKWLLGPYYVDLPMAVLSAPIKSSGPSPELAQLDGAKVAFIAEPNKTDQIKEGQVKVLTGKDSIFGRFCNQNGGSIEIKAAAILVCNKIPPIPVSDEATEERVDVIPFLSKWASHGVPEKEAQRFEQKLFKKDPLWIHQVKKLPPAFLWILVHKFKDYAAKGLGDKPKLVKDYTAQYWADNSLYKAFVSEALIKTNEPAYVIDVDSTIRAFKKFYWSREKGAGKHLPEHSILKSELRRELGAYNSPSGQGWTNYTIKGEYRAQEHQPQN
jgi:phage/plasmid-associated DNA primase